LGDVLTEMRERCDGPPSATAQRRTSERQLAELYRDNIDRLRNYLTGILKSEADADDMAQEAFLRLHRCGDLASYGNPRAVLFKTGYRLALNCLRGRRSNPLDRSLAVLDEIVTAPEGATTVEDVLIAREQETAYGRVLASLPPRCRQVIELRTVQELSYKEMSDTLGLSVSTLEKHIVKGKRVAAEALAGWWTGAPAAVAA
jgi:RNA polymerase sigma factor (sigma-70 family)